MLKYVSLISIPHKTFTKSRLPVTDSGECMDNNVVMAAPGGVHIFFINIFCSLRNLVNFKTQYCASQNNTGKRDHVLLLLLPLMHQKIPMHLLANTGNDSECHTERRKTKRAARKVAVIDVFAVRVMRGWSPFQRQHNILVCTSMYFTSVFCEFKTACNSVINLRGAATMSPRAKTTAG
jgi:hypothetical protein